MNMGNAMPIRADPYGHHGADTKAAGGRRG